MERAAYVTRSRRLQMRTGRTFDFRDRGDLVGEDLLLPSEEPLPSFAHDGVALFDRLEASATRVDAVLGLEIVAALPLASETTWDENREILRAFARRHLVEPHRLAVLIASHDPHAALDPDEIEAGARENRHAHFVLPLLPVHANGFGPRVDALLPVRLGAITLDAVPWGRLWAHHLDEAAARLGRAWRVRRPAPVRGHHVGPAAARRVLTREIEAGRDAILCSEIEGRNRLICGDPDNVRQAFSGRPFRVADVECLLARFADAGEDEDDRALLCAAVLASPECRRLVDPHGGVTPWYASGLDILSQRRVLALATSLSGKRARPAPARAGEAAPILADDRRLRLVAVGALADEVDFVRDVVAGETARGAAVLALSHNAGTVAPWHRAGCTLFSLAHVPRIVPRRGATLILDGAEQASVQALETALDLAEAASGRLLVLWRAPGPSAWLLEVIGQACGLLRVGSHADGRARDLLPEPVRVLRRLAAEGRVHLVATAEEAGAAARALTCGGEPAVLLDASALGAYQRACAVAARSGTPPPGLAAGAERVVVVHDASGSAALVAAAIGAVPPDRIDIVADRRLTPTLADLERQVAVSLGLGSAIDLALAPAAAHECEAVRTFEDDVMFWAEVEQALLRRRAAGLDDDWPGRAFRGVLPPEGPSAPLSSHEVARIAADERAFAGLLRPLGKALLPGLAHDDLGPDSPPHLGLHSQEPARELEPTLPAAADFRPSTEQRQPVSVDEAPALVSPSDSDPSAAPALANGERRVRGSPAGAGGSRREPARGRGRHAASDEEAATSDPAPPSPVEVVIDDGVDASVESGDVADDEGPFFGPR